jgi:hypothetical protein
LEKSLGIFRWVIIALVCLWAATGFTEALANGPGPIIGRIQFPSRVTVGSSAQGIISFNQAYGGISSLEFHVIDGRYAMTQQSVNIISDSGNVRFSLDCTNYAQEISLSVRVRNLQGIPSQPSLLRFQCGEPRHYNFEQEQTQQTAITDNITVHFIIVEDDQSSLAENAASLASNYWKTPSLEVVSAIENTVLPSMTGIWDQCGMALQRGEVRVLKQEALAQWQTESGISLFDTYQGQDAYYVRDFGLHPFSMLHATLSSELRAEGILLPAHEPVIYLVGAQIISVSNSSLSPIEGFSLQSVPSPSVVRWGHAHRLENGDYMQPRQMVATSSHEIGHFLGLGHPGEDGLQTSLHDESNLMKGSSVTPQPRANVLEEQCQLATQTLNTLTTQAALAQQHTASDSAPTSNDANAAAATMPMMWDNLHDEDVVSGQVELRIEPQDITPFISSGFAEFTYSSDEDRWIYIALDRETSDGFSGRWDTTELTPGAYTVRVMLVDSNRNKYYAFIHVVVEQT